MSSRDCPVLSLQKTNLKRVAVAHIVYHYVLSSVRVETLIAFTDGLLEQACDDVKLNMPICYSNFNLSLGLR
jgi:hypothetical protein